MSIMSLFRFFTGNGRLCWKCNNGNCLTDVPEVLNTDIIDAVATITNDEAFETARQVAKLEGILCGISSGAAVKAALDLAARSENRGKQIVAVLPSTGERYLSTDLFVKE